jgi:hypothetical protein
MKRHLTIILRTCTRVNMINDMGNGRYIKVPKTELTRTCVSSLVNSINQVKGHNIKLYVLDDHSDTESISELTNILNKCNFPTTLISVTDGTGNGFTMGKVYDLVEKEATDLWYHIEDDYLHYPEAIQDMIDSVDQFESNTGQMVAINPHDDIWRYTNEIYESILLLGPYRHYRTVKHTTYTCLASKQIYNKYRNHFRDVVKLSLMKADWVENKSINLVWNKPDVMLFSPIPGLGFHIMDESGKDPYIDIEALWDSVPKLWKDETKEKFAVVSMFNDSHKELGNITWKNKKEYADKHNYRSICKTENWTLQPIHFEKIKLMLEVLNNDPDIDWAWWLDNDAIVTNKNIKLESIVDQNYHVIITCDIASINAGSFLVRNSLQGKQWLEFILKKGLEHYRDNRWPEQQPMTDFYITFKDIVKVVPQRTMNSYDYQIYRVDPTDQLGYSGQWEPTDFVLHMPGLNNDTRIKIIKHIEHLSGNQ